MKRPILLLFAGLMCGLLVATGALFASGAGERLSAPGETLAAVGPIKNAAPQEADGSFVVQTGQSFGGLHLQGVIPCSSMVVKGGGHLVIVTRHERPLESCSFHIKDTKRIEIDGHAYQVSVVKDDTIRALPVTGEKADDQPAQVAAAR